MAKIDEDELLDSWAASAARMDEFVIVSDIREAAAARADTDAMEVERARAAIMAGRPALAAGLLADVERSVLVATSHSWRDVIALAAWAALGDADALSALHRAGQTIDGSAMVIHRYLLAAAAEQAGQSELADSVWADVAEVTEPTMVVRRRNVVADVFHRSTSDVESAATTLGRSARVVIDMMPFPEDDLRPTRDVVDRLEARGDHAGALLVLEVMAAFRPGARELRALLKERAAGGGWWHERIPGLVAAMCATALAVLCTLTGLSHWITFGGALGAFVVWHLWRLPQGRGLSAVDARVLSGARAQMPDVAANVPDRVRRLGGAITGGALAFVGTLALVSVVMEVLLADAYRANMATFDAVAWPLVWLATVIGGAAGPHLLRGLQTKAARKYVAQLRSTQVEGVRGCVCLSTIGMRGIETDAYTSRHLRTAEPVVVAMVPAIPTATVQALQCPVSHTPWLLVRLPGCEALLFRGTLKRVVDAPDDAVGGYL